MNESLPNVVVPDPVTPEPVVSDPVAPGPVPPSPVPPRPRGRSRAGVAFRFAFLGAAVGALIWMLDHIGWDRIAGHIELVGIGGGLLLLGLGFLEAALDAESFRAAFPVPVSRLYLFSANQAGAFVNRIIPLESGEVLKGALLSRRASTQDAVVATVLWNYVFKLAKPAAASLSLAVGLLFGDEFLRGVAVWMIPAAALSFLPWAGMKLLITIGLGGLFTRLVRLLHLPVKDPDALVARAGEIDRLVRDFKRRRPAAWRAMFVWLVLGRVCSWASYWYVLSLIDRTYDLATTGMIWTGFQVMGYLIAVLPSRLGTTEAGGYVLFQVLGQDPATGLTTQVILTLRAILVNGISGMLLVFQDTSPRVPPPAGGPDPA